MAEASLKLGGGNWGVKEDSILGYNDENGNYKPIPFDFSRASIGTRVNRDGLIEVVQDNIPRIDFSSGEGLLLLEPQRTNSLLQSNQFDTTWTTSNASVTSGQSGYDGSSDAWLLNATANSDCYLIQTPVYNSGIRTRSLYAKANTFSQLTFLFAPFNGNKYATFNLSNGTYTNDGCLADIEDVGNGWYRCIATITDASNTYPFLFGLSNESGVHPNIGDSIYIQYAQIEEGSYPTSYIPTSGSAVTRVADSCSKTSANDLIGQTEGTLFLEINISHLDGVVARDLFFLSNTNNLSDDWVGIGFSGIGSNALRARVSDGGVIKFDQYGTITSTATYKIALAYKSGDSEFYINGVSFGTNYANTSFSLTLDRIFDSPNFTFGDSIKQVLLYKTRISNAELAELTS